MWGEVAAYRPALPLLFDARPAAMSMHGGSTGVALRAAERRLAIAKVGTMLGIPKDVDPADALLDAVRLAAGDIEYLRIQVQDHRWVYAAVFAAMALAGIGFEVSRERRRRR